MGLMLTTCPVCEQEAIVIPMAQQTPADKGVPGVLLEGDDWSKGCGCRSGEQLTAGTVDAGGLAETVDNAVTLE